MMNEEKISEELRRELLAKVGATVGLLIDAHAIDGAPGGGARRFKKERISSVNGVSRLTRLYSLPMAGGEARAPRHSCVLFKSSDGTHRIATSAHCITVDEEWRKQVRAVVGIADIEQEFSAAQVIELGGIQHYEDMPDRDLAILIARIQAPTMSTMSFPGGAPGVAVGDRVYVVGHAGGLNMEVFPGLVKSRVEPGGRLSGLNIEVSGSRRCLSGSPVFTWAAGGEPALFGVLQGLKEVVIPAPDGVMKAIPPADDCLDPPSRDTYHIVFLGGGMSAFFKRVWI